MSKGKSIGCNETPKLERPWVGEPSERLQASTYAKDLQSPTDFLYGAQDKKIFKWRGFDILVVS